MELYDELPACEYRLSNLKDGGGNPTTITATLLDGFTQPGSTGWVTGNNDAIYPQSVVQNFYYLYNSSVKTSRIQISGLNNAMQYNFVFFNSQWDGTPGMTYFTINGVTDSLQADWNINKTVQINGVIPVNGVVTIGVSKGPAATVAYINSIVIQGYSQAAGYVVEPNRADRYGSYADDSEPALAGPVGDRDGLPGIPGQRCHRVLFADCNPAGQCGDLPGYEADQGS